MSSATKIYTCGCGAVISAAKCGQEWCRKCAWSEREWYNGSPANLYCRCHRTSVNADAHCTSWIKDDS